MDLEQNEILRAKYNPEGSELRNAQLRMLEILDYIVDICDKNGLQYWLCGGTMLGAIRHGGFIPWDDDLDIEMPKSDYKKLLKIFRHNLPENLEIHNHSTDSNYVLLFSKLRDKDSIYHEQGNARHWRKRGCFVDIFAMEKSSRWIANFAYQWYSYIDRLMAHDYVHMANIAFLFFKGIVQPAARFLSLFSSEQAIYQPLGKYKNNPRYTKDLFPLQKICFEGRMLNAPANIDGYLKQIFGNDYMTLPKEIIVHTHKIEVFKHEEI